MLLFSAAKFFFLSSVSLFNFIIRFDVFVLHLLPEPVQFLAATS